MTDVPTADSLRPGSVVGPWRIEGYAGRGTYGLVFRARLAGYPESPLVALKVAVFAYDPRFMREAALLSRFHHPSIPRLLARGWWVASPKAAHPYLVLEWIHGLPLYEWARQHQVTSRQVLGVLAQVAGALAVLHQSDCLHRDLKGDNILVDAKGRAVLMDYGSGTWAGAPPITESLMPPNTPEYRSPEAFRFEWGQWRVQRARYQARPADDLYALGVSLYRLVTRVYPPPGTEPEELKEQPHARPPQRLPPEALNERVAPELAEFIEQLLAAEPDARGTACEVADAAQAAEELAGPLADVPLFYVNALPAESSAVPPTNVVASRLAPLCTEPRSHAGMWRLGLAVAALVLATVGTRWMAPAISPPLPKQVQLRVPSAAVAADAGPAGLGDDGKRTPPKAGQDAPSSEKGASLPLPKEPLPGQRRAPCERGEMAIHGGCWIPWTTRVPPCGDQAYEWKGGCYLPRLNPARMPTTEKPQ
ncbi:hypothetical protein DB31_1296 [Hyalangium minutum]|uniref:non-specific serine/threonine protein kinase n=2 Tax=Hyalangium minutum TaxID=394096 RepID=A0A085WEW8_9BACT|nr:hypothetical protein DB31_1296 [Hyalangium minutum]